MVAISQAPSPKSNPNSSSPVEAMVVQYTTIKADGSEAFLIYQDDLLGETHSQTRVCIVLKARIKSVQACISPGCTRDIQIEVKSIKLQLL